MQRDLFTSPYAPDAPTTVRALAHLKSAMNHLNAAGDETDDNATRTKVERLNVEIVTLMRAIAAKES